MADQALRDPDIEDLLSSFPLNPSCDRLIPKSSIGSALENVIHQYNNLISQFVVPVGHTLPTTDHIKELAELNSKQFKDACLELNGEFSRVSCEWELKYLEEGDRKLMENYKTSISRQEYLMQQIKEKLHEEISLNSTSQKNCGENVS